MHYAFRLLAVLFISLFFVLSTHAQAPELIQYSAVLRGADNLPLPTQGISVRFSVLQGGQAGTVVYRETHSATTSAIGLFNLQIGAGTVISGTMAGIDWASDTYFIQIEVDVSGGTNYQTFGTSQLASVPYALHAKTADVAVNDGDTDSQNELQSISIVGDTLFISQGNGVLLPTLGGGANQTLSINNDTLSLSSGGSVVLPSDGDGDATNELQALSISNDTVFLTNGGFVKLPAGSSSGNIGNSHIILAGDITDAQAATLIQQTAGPNTQIVWILNTTQLTTANLTGLSALTNIRIEDNEALQSVSFPDVTDIYEDINVEDNRQLISLTLPSLINTYGTVTIRNDSALATFSLPAFTTAYRDILINRNPALTTIAFANLTSISASFGFPDNEMLSTVSLPNLVFVEGNIGFGGFFFGLSSSNSSLTSLAFPALERVEGAFSISGEALTTLSVPSLEWVGQRVDMSSNPVLVSVNFPSLISTGGASISGNDLLQSISFPVLATNRSQFIVNNNPILSSVQLPLLEDGGGDIWLYFNALTSFSLPSLQALRNSGAVRLNDNQLGSASINTVLSQLVNITPTLTNKTIELQNQTPPAPPTGQGLIDRQTLITNGNSVTTD